MYIEQRDECGPLMYRSCEVCSHAKVRSPPAHPLRACWESSVLRSVALPLVGASLSRESHAHSGVMLMAGPRPPSPGSFHIRGFLTTIVDWKKRVGKGGGGPRSLFEFLLASTDRLATAEAQRQGQGDCSDLLDKCEMGLIVIREIRRF